VIALSVLFWIIAIVAGWVMSKEKNAPLHVFVGWCLIMSFFVITFYTKMNEYYGIPMHNKIDRMLASIGSLLNKK